MAVQIHNRILMCWQKRKRRLLSSKGDEQCVTVPTYGSSFRINKKKSRNRSWIASGTFPLFLFVCSPQLGSVSGYRNASPTPFIPFGTTMKPSLVVEHEPDETNKKENSDIGAEIGTRDNDGPTYLLTKLHNNDVSKWTLPFFTTRSQQFDFFNVFSWNE